MSDEEEDDSLKVVAVGDGGAGKTSLLTRFLHNRFSSDYVPTVFEESCRDLTLPDSGRTATLQLWDTAGQEAYSQTRPIVYKRSDIFILCYSIAQPDALDNVRLVWSPELRRHCPAASVFLVGTKLDLASDAGTIMRLRARGQEPIGTRRGQAMAKTIQAQGHLECSALSGENVQLVFERAIDAHWRRKSGGGGRRAERWWRRFCCFWRSAVPCRK